MSFSLDNDFLRNPFSIIHPLIPQTFHDSMVITGLWAGWVSVSLPSRHLLFSSIPGKQLKYKRGPWRMYHLSAGQSNKTKGTTPWRQRHELCQKGQAETLIPLMTSQDPPEETPLFPQAVCAIKHEKQQYKARKGRGWPRAPSSGYHCPGLYAMSQSAAALVTWWQGRPCLGSLSAGKGHGRHLLAPQQDSRLLGRAAGQLAGLPESLSHVVRQRDTEMAQTSQIGLALEPPLPRSRTPWALR